LSQKKLNLTQQTNKKKLFLAQKHAFKKQYDYSE